jgi:O-antigen/teichoic acid export membrane protein
MTPVAERRRQDHAMMVLSQFASAGGSLALLLVTARQLGPSGRGVFAFFLLWPTLGAYVAAFGLPGANLKRAAEEPGAAARLTGNALLFSLAMGAVLAAVVAAGAPRWLVGPMSGTVVWLACGATVAMLAFNALTWIQMGLGSYVLPNLLKAAFPLLSAAVLLAFAAAGAGAGVTASCAVYSGAVLVATVVAVADLRRHGAPRVDLPLLRGSLAYGVRYQAGLVAQLATYRADQWVLGASRGAPGLGVYSVAVSTSEIATYLATARGMTTFRDAARGLRRPERAMVGEVVLVTALSAVLVGLAGGLTLPWVFGEGYADAVHLLLLLLPGTVGVGLLRVCGNELAGRGRPGAVAVIATVQAAAMVALFVVLIPRRGVDAAAIVSSAGYLAGGAACAVLLVRMPGRERG